MKRVRSRGGTKMHNVLTQENMKKLQDELEYRMTVKRSEIAKEKLVELNG